MTSILLDTDLAPQQRDHCEMIYSSANNLLGVINDILDFSKIEAGKLDLENIEFDLRENVDETVELLALKALEKNLHFACVVDHDVPSLLRGDPGRLRQILVNLANNAVKFTQAGSVEIRISVAESRLAWTRVRFEISDTGVGIPPASLQNIFASFSQVDTSTTRKFGGSGLGLTIAKQLTELMDGEIGVKSDEGSGTTFWFTVDFALPGLVKSTTAPPKQSGGRRVLVCHRHAATRASLREQLTFGGYTCADCERGDDAVAAQAEAAGAGRPYELVLIDSGAAADTDLTQRLRAAAGDCAAALILLAEPGDPHDSDHLAGDGFAMAIMLPTGHKKLLTALGYLAADRTVPPPVTSDAVADENGVAAGLPVLLAEDNPVNQKVASLMLTKLGYQVDVVPDGRQALTALAQRDYAALLLDVQMPEMDGYEVARRIRAGEDGVRNPDLPIIALTAHAMKDDRRHSHDVGMNEHVSKPIDAVTIGEILARHIDRTEPVLS
jgi:CheY-like chemotaxis protein